MSTHAAIAAEAARTRKLRRQRVRRIGRHAILLAWTGVIVFPIFDQVYRTNEHRMLDQLVLSSTSCGSPGIAGAASVLRRPQYDLYRIERGC